MRSSFTQIPALRAFLINSSTCLEVLSRVLTSIARPLPCLLPTLCFPPVVDVTVNPWCLANFDRSSQFLNVVGAAAAAGFAGRAAGAAVGFAGAAACAGFGVGAAVNGAFVIDFGDNLVGCATALGLSDGLTCTGGGSLIADAVDD